MLNFSWAFFLLGGSHPKSPKGLTSATAEVSFTLGKSVAGGPQQVPGPHQAGASSGAGGGPSAHTPSEGSSAATADCMEPSLADGVGIAAPAATDNAAGS